MNAVKPFSSIPLRVFSNRVLEAFRPIPDEPYLRERKARAEKRRLAEAAAAANTDHRNNTDQKNNTNDDDNNNGHNTTSADDYDYDDDPEFEKALSKLFPDGKDTDDYKRVMRGAHRYAHYLLERPEKHHIMDLLNEIFHQLRFG